LRLSFFHFSPLSSCGAAPGMLPPGSSRRTGTFIASSSSSTLSFSFPPPFFPPFFPLPPLFCPASLRGADHVPQKQCRLTPLFEAILSLFPFLSFFLFPFFSFFFLPPLLRDIAEKRKRTKTAPLSAALRPSSFLPPFFPPPLLFFPWNIQQIRKRRSNQAWRKAGHPIRSLFFPSFFFPFFFFFPHFLFPLTWGITDG